MAEALQFAEGRFKNEAGVNSRIFFQWLAYNFVDHFASKSLNTDSVDIKESKSSVRQLMLF
jgi:hypothetical protein